VKADPRERLSEYVLGTLAPGELAGLRAEVDASPELQREVAHLTEALAHTAGVLPPVRPSPAARTRLLEALGGPDRFRPFFAELARRFDLSVQAVRDLLARVDDPAAWEASPSPSVKLIHFPGGPALAGADAGFVRVAAGQTFPRHSHQGPELAFVLEGRMIKDGRVYHPGDIDEVPTEEIHEYSVGEERDLVVMVWHHGIRFIKEPRG
jgi:quercetin dioxygenase-like cupin family protein